jgi:hypothetical protein
MLPFDVRHPSRDAENHDSRFYSLYTREASRFSTADITFSFAAASRLKHGASTRPQTPLDERLSYLPDHLIDSRPRFPAVGANLRDRHGFQILSNAHQGIRQAFDGSANTDLAVEPADEVLGLRFNTLALTAVMVVIRRNERV